MRVLERAHPHPHATFVDFSARGARRPWTPFVCEKMCARREKITGTVPERERERGWTFGVITLSGRRLSQRSEFHTDERGGR